MGSRGLTATLVRSKTLGSDKPRQQTMTVWVSPEAYLAVPSWLSVGWALWLAQGLDRDYFLVLPTTDFTGTLQLEPSYADLLALSRLCSTQLPGHHGDLFLPDRRLSLAWSGHSERGTLPSWVSSLGSFTDDDVDQLGRWRTRTSRRYIRNTAGLVRRMQEAAATAFRTRDPLGDPFSEEHVLEG